MTSFVELRNSLFEHYFERRYREALEMLDGYAPADRSEDEDLFFWRMCLRSRLGETDAALSLFSDALDRGHWWSEHMLRDSDLDPLRDLSEWKALVERSDELRSIEPAPELKPTVLPSIGSGAGDRRALIVLHVPSSRPEVEVEHWRSATEHGWTVVAPRSSQRLSAAGRYGWHDLQRAQTDVATQLEGIEPLPHGGLVMAGFSQGGGLAVQLVCGGHLAVTGMVLLAPTFHWGLPKETASAPTRSWIFLGDEEHPRISEAVEQLGAMLRGAGWPVHIERLAGVGHAHPPSFDDRLSAALASIG